jgi:hypothetical protein
VEVLMAQTVRILQIRSINLSKRIVEDWKIINEKMHMEAVTAK